jgi:hypothetical protein
MAIDDPISALQSLEASDQRQRSPVTRFAKQFLSIVKMFSLGNELTFAGIEAAVDWVSRREEENRQEFVEALAEQLRHRGSQIEQLLATSERHRRFMAEEMPGIVLDALRRAERARTKQQIHRLAKALIHTAAAGPSDGVDVAGEMLGLTMAVSENEVRVLQATVEQNEIETRRQPHQDRYTRGLIAWDRVRDIVGLEVDELESTGSKLQSLGLLGVRQPSAPDRTAFVVLQKGQRFLAYIRSNARH